MMENPSILRFSVMTRWGEVLYPRPVKMMRDHIGLSQRNMAQQATRETMPRAVTPTVQWPVEERKAGWFARLVARLFGVLP